MVPRTIIIAEAGVNHNGSLDLAKKLAEVAKESGADYIKFQTFKAEMLSSIKAPQAEYQMKNTNSKESQVKMLKRLEMNNQFHNQIYEFCKRIDIGFLSSAFHQNDLDFLRKFNMDYIKIPSGEITNHRYLKFACACNKKIILSTGMSYLSEVESALNLLIGEGIYRSNIWLLQCTTEYPAPYDSVNLNVMNTYKNKFNVNVGYSDHTLGIEVAIAAVSLGCQMLEKHITLDKNMEGPDHIASLEPSELSSMISAIRNVEQALGSGVKSPSKVEKENIKVVRKSIVAIAPIPQGTLFTTENIGCKRPGTGISPINYEDYLGRKSLREYDVDELIDQ
ncbi:N-acetylneuraminate synthase [Prochlorococcus sp. MIT 1307]|uniref:N-acetylneuraminate synthase n=1 Tax=Prochlorococcus sp. MIT 1307 TaxID=3096219 RepID=UPI002A755F18|nr:N-acetylneuraminate synthase [Prochlorococcus sp. MIT 1307]